MDAGINIRYQPLFVYLIILLRDTVHLERKVILYTVYLSPEIAKLNEEIENTYALGEDIFYNIRPSFSNFSEAYGVFGLYNEDFREVVY